MEPPPNFLPFSYHTSATKQVNMLLLILVLDTWSQPLHLFKLPLVLRHMATQHTQRTICPLLHTVHGLTDAHDRLESLWLTGDRVLPSLPSKTHGQPTLLDSQSRLATTFEYAIFTCFCVAPFGSPPAKYFCSLKKLAVVQHLLNTNHHGFGSGSSVVANNGEGRVFTGFYKRIFLFTFTFSGLISELTT